MPLARARRAAERGLRAARMQLIDELTHLRRIGAELGAVAIEAGGDDGHESLRKERACLDEHGKAMRLRLSSRASRTAVRPGTHNHSSIEKLQSMGPRFRGDDQLCGAAATPALPGVGR